MAPEWEMGMGMEFGVGMGMGGAANNAPAFPVAASPAYLYGLPSSDTLRIDDLLDFSNHELFPSAADPHLLPPPDSSSAGGGGGGGRPFDGESGSSSNNRQQFAAFPDDLYIPSEEAAELEWLSKFVEESFSDVPYPSSGVVSGAHIRPDPSAAIASRGARSKRSRGPSSSSAAAAAAATWSSLAPPHPSRTSSSSTSSSSSSDFPSSKSERKKGGPSAEAAAEGGLGVEGGVRRCTHCASEKTPQWRTGPLGPKTLCNACGVRYKSGRLVPEYRPAASPTFVLTQHSNSHRKVMELRRQKEIHLLRRDAAGGAAAASSSSGARGEMLFHDYEVC